MSRFVGWLALGAVVFFGLSGCGGSSAPAVNPTPIMTSISPEHTTAGGGAFQLNVVALDIEKSSVVNWNGSPRTTTPDPNTGQLVAQILATDIANPGSAEITVFTPTPGGGTSNSLTFFIDAPDNPVPTISGLNPSSTAAGGMAFSLMVTGTNFVSNSSVNWNGSPRTTTFGSATQLTVSILASDIATAGSANVTVSTPAPGGGTSAPVSFSITGGASVPAGSKAAVFTLVSVSAFGDASNGPSGAPRMDETGRFVAFESAATNLLASGAKAGVFVRDTCHGAAHCTPETVAVDVARSGDGPNGGLGRGLAISAEGRYVAFSSRATNLASSSFHAGPQIFLRDTCLGGAATSNCTPSTTLISVGLNGMPGDAASEFPSVSAGGRFVAFASAATNFVAGASADAAQIYLRDTCLGSAPADCVPRTILISQDAAGGAGKGASLQASISRDGRYVAFDSVAPNLVAGSFSGSSNVFLRDTCQGESAPAGCAPYTALFSVSLNGLAADGASFAPAISYYGRYVAFVTRAGNIAEGDASHAQKIVVRDTCLNVPQTEPCAPMSRLVSSQGFGQAHTPFISGDGRFVSYVADGGSAMGGAIRVFLGDTCVGVGASSVCAPRTTLIATSGPGKASELAGGLSGFGAPVSLDGEAIALFSTGPVPGLKRNLNGVGDVLVGVMSTAP
ncbi:MAG: IPT/TIG domain-containing protein [Candidatus Acidiferrales bacterium]